MNQLLLVVFCLFPAFASARALDIEQVKIRASIDEASLSEGQHAQLVASLKEIARIVSADCPASDRADRRLPFTLVMELDASGKVLSTWITGESEFSGCLSKTMSRSLLFVPPKAPFFTSFEYTFSNG
ncbi:MAG: hypothetical protein ABIR62_03740 [Dokdonella sp.]|uniref:hypothetical protein n=1 Tax=Dokdonella sp. TaxID=2291710 RepID=UPI0032633FBF